MLRDSKFKRTDRQLLPSPPSINDFNHFLYAAQKLNGRWVDFSWKAANGQMFTVSVSWSGTLSSPVWRLYGGDESKSLQWEHQSCDVPLVFNLVATHSGMNDRVVNAEKALSKTRGSLGEGEAHSEFYGFNETVQGALPPQKLDLKDLKNLSPETFQTKAEESVQPAIEPQARRTSNGYPEQFICTKTSLLTYQGFLFLLEREYELAKRTNLPLTLLLFSAARKPQKGSRATTSDISILKVLPYIAIVQRKSDTLAHYKDGQLAVLLPNTSITGAKSAARRILRALDKAEDPEFQAWRFSVAATDLINDAPALDAALTAADEASMAAKKSDANVVAYRDVLLNMTADELTNRLKQQQKLNAQAQTSRATLVSHLKNEIVSKTTGLLILPVLRFFLEHDQKRALREKRSVTLLVLELAALPSGASTLLATSELVRHEGLQCLAQIKRKVDILGEYEGNRIALILPDTSLAQVRAVTERIKKTVREQLISKLGPAAELYISISAADVMDHYPNLNFKPI
jgi:GGDEF domain-containing protein